MTRLNHSFEYLVYSKVSNNKEPKLAICDTLQTALVQWKHHSRISPIFSINRANNKKLDLSGTKHIILFGPYNPTQLDRFIYKEKNVQVRYTLGLYNIIIVTPRKKLLNEFKNDLTKQNISYEIWTVKSGKIIYTDYTINNTEKSTVDINENLIKYLSIPDLYGILNEYLVLLNITIQRINNCQPNLLKEFLEINENIKLTIEKELNEDQIKNIQEIFGICTTTNSALARFTSQTFSGIAPLFETESHYWSHSLFGIGMASLAIINLRRFIQKTVGNIRIPELIHLQQYNTNVFNLREAQKTEDIWKRDNIQEFTNFVKLYEQKKNVKLFKKIYPLITFFSGRDGYKTYTNALAIPIETIYAANTIMWSLYTITHEISHNIIKGVLGVLYSTKHIKNNNIMELFIPGRKPENLLEDMQLYLFNSILDLQEKENENESLKNYHVEANEDECTDILYNWKLEVEEIMAHVFDCLYFYGGSVDKYLEELWTTWSVIPNIHNRIPEYLLRSLCAVYAMLAERKVESDQETYKSLQTNLVRLQKKMPELNFLTQALIQLEKNWESKLKTKLNNRKFIINFTRTFLYSKNIRTEIYAEVLGKSRKKGKDDTYKATIYEIDDTPISNPLRFIDEYTKDSRPDLVKSFWLFYKLAFNYVD